MVVRPRHPTGRAKIEESDTGSDLEVDGFSLVDASQHLLHVPYRPAPAVEDPKEPTKDQVRISFEKWARFEDVDDWQSVDAYPKSGIHKHPDLADSSATIRPMVASPAATQMRAPIDEDDASGYDSEWSVVDKPVTKVVSFV